MAEKLASLLWSSKLFTTASFIFVFIVHLVLKLQSHALYGTCSINTLISTYIFFLNTCTKYLPPYVNRFLSKIGFLNPLQLFHLFISDWIGIKILWHYHSCVFSSRLNLMVTWPSPANFFGWDITWKSGLKRWRSQLFTYKKNVIKKLVVMNLALNKIYSVVTWNWDKV